ncbi:hypothetical protein ACOSB0_00095, partial [Candidatus Phytoplasma citri]
DKTVRIERGPKADNIMLQQSRSRNMTGGSVMGDGGISNRRERERERERERDHAQDCCGQICGF